jgi:hypothetical protein
MECSDFHFFHISRIVIPSLPSLGPKSSENVNEQNSVSYKLFWTFSKICNDSEILITNFPSNNKQIFAKFQAITYDNKLR